MVLKILLAKATGTLRPTSQIACTLLEYMKDEVERLDHAISHRFGLVEVVRVSPWADIPAFGNGECLDVLYCHSEYRKEHERALTDELEEVVAYSKDDSARSLGEH